MEIIYEEEIAQILELKKTKEHLQIFCELYYEELKKIKESLFYDTKEWIEFFMDNDFYENINDNIEVGDYVKIYNGKEYIWCEVKRTHKHFKENNNKILGENYLTARIDNILSIQNEKYDYNTIIKLKFIHINEFCKKDYLFLQYFKK